MRLVLICVIAKKIATTKSNSFGTCISKHQVNVAFICLFTFVIHIIIIGFTASSSSQSSDALFLMHTSFVCVCGVHNQVSGTRF